MEKKELLERYEAFGDESVYAEARRVYEQALADDGGDARVLHEFGYLQECHGRRDIRAAAACYERAIDADPHYDQAAQVIHAGLELAPDDPSLTEQQGDLFEATGRPEDALACWQRAFTLDPDNLSARYSTAFLLERQDRLAEAAAEWRFIIGWCEEHGYAISADWPRRMLQGLEARLAGS